MVGTSGKLIIADGRAKRLLFFDTGGKLVREIKAGNDGLGGLQGVGAIAVDVNDNLFVFSLRDGSVAVLAAPTYRVERRFQLAGAVTDFVALRDGGVVTYYPAEEAGVFRRFDRAGGQLGAVHRVTDENLRIFHARVQNGGITQDSNGDIVGLHPSAFQLVRMSPDLKVKEILRGSKGDPWAPNPPAFPRGLNPV